ncbi:META domain-containing protein [Mastigocoleus sp. MO_188.B34]|uniref:META domain-containing protein n=1 Tax=Mastigocoleus sp. MO_188.B34 TaxID=3036635 RepID=UPI00262B8A00|nr:META domain-containing protein [Mastigocoleus sp. MO_188.B34]MDJ0694521.1 META domain-containing protein [Mastigocoleus sp. MO_188.B34]
MTKKKVPTVDKIYILTESPIIKASGTVSTGGWTDGELIPRPVSSGNGLEFDFVAQPPDGLVLPVISSIEASYKLSPEEQNYNLYKVYADGNHKVISTQVNIEGSWILKSGVETQILPNTKITAEFNDGRISGSGGCNRYFSNYTVKPLDGSSGKIQIQNIASTLISCSVEIDTQERSYLNALQQVKEYKLTDEGLILTYPSASSYLLFTRQ